MARKQTSPAPSGRPSRRRAPGKGRRTLEVHDLMAIERISQPAVHPDGRCVAFVTTRPDLAKNESRQTIRLLEFDTGGIRELTPGPGKHSQPAWSPDGRWLAFVSDRDANQGRQLWVMPAGGGEARRVTGGYGGVEGPLWAPDSKRIVFAREVVVSADYRPKKAGAVDPQKGPERAAVYGLVNERSSARICDGLLFRHWDAWRDRRRKHLFIVDVSTGKLSDVTPHDCDVPPIAAGSERDYDFGPGGRELAFAMNPDKAVARSTNNCIFIQPLRGIRAAGDLVCISTSEAADCHPRYSPDGRSIIYLAMQKPKYEADRNRIKVYDRTGRETRVLLQRFDRSPAAFELASPGELFFLAADRGRQSVYRLDLGNGRVRQLTCGTYNGSLRAIPGHAELLVTRESTREPADFYLLTPPPGITPRLETGPLPPALPVDAGARAERLSHYGEALAKVAMHPAEEFWYPGDGETPVHGFLIRPPRFQQGRRYPLIVLIHGGPQSAFADHFHYRWNAQLFAARGAAVALLNPRGSIGYGQKFTDQISGDWGGRCYRDIMRGVDYLVKTYRFLDRRRIAAAGASFGGFMVNWIAGQTDRFRALVCHDGIFNAETMAYTTEELWFDEHEHGGLPHENRRAYLKFSPHLHVADFTTPMLIVHGNEDFRCPISEGIGMFTALQVRGVPSRFLYFPDEGHWVMQPANAEVWYQEVSNWLMHHLAG